MTRINVIPVTALCDQHLLAEHRELVRIPNAIRKGRYCLKGQPKTYVMGTGHVKFFYDKLLYLRNRYADLHLECVARGFAPTWNWDFPLIPVDMTLWNDYKPTLEAVKINIDRVQARMDNFKPRWTPHIADPTFESISFYRGYPLGRKGEKFVVLTTGEPSETFPWAQRPCGHCGKVNTVEGYDGCIGTVPRAQKACCGHGQSESAYIQWDDGHTLRGYDAIETFFLIRLFKEEPDEFN